jgi:hypothetical protein
MMARAIISRGDPMSPQACEAEWAMLPAICGAPAVGQYRRACVHEHVRDGWLCALHAEIPEHALCKACHDFDGHECPVGLARIGDAPQAVLADGSYSATPPGGEPA